MTSTTDLTSQPPTESTPSLAIAGQIIDGLAARDFDAVVAAMVDDVHFRALLPSRVMDLNDRAEVRAAFDMWFGGAERWELVEAIVGEVGGRLHLRWRLHVVNPDRGAGTLLVEQQVYADVAADGRLTDVSLMCTGYRPLSS